MVCRTVHEKMNIHVLLLRTHEYDLVDRRSLSSYNEGTLFEISLSDLYCSKGTQGQGERLWGNTASSQVSLVATKTS